MTLLLDETEKFFHCHWQNTRATMNNLTETVKLALPDDSDSSHPNQAPVGKTLNLLLAANNEVYAYNGDSLDEVLDLGADPTVLRSALMRKKNEIRIRFGSDSGMIVLIKPTPHATYGNLIDALDEMQICAVKAYTLMDPDKTELKKNR